MKENEKVEEKNWKKEYSEKLKKKISRQKRIENQRGKLDQKI